MPRYTVLGSDSGVSGVVDSVYEDDAPLLVLGGGASVTSPTVSGGKGGAGGGTGSDTESIVTPAIRRRAIWIVGGLVMVNVGVLGTLGVVGAR